MNRNFVLADVKLMALLMKFIELSIPSITGRINNESTLMGTLMVFYTKMIPYQVMAGESWLVEMLSLGS